MPSKAGAAWSPAQEFAKDVAAFANNRGGQVVLGVRDREKIACSIRPLTDSFEHIERKLRKWLRDHLSPAVSVEIDEVPVDGGIVVVVTVPQSTDQPHAVMKRPGFRDCSVHWVTGSGAGVA